MHGDGRQVLAFQRVRLLLDRSGDEEEPLYVLADPAGHPFCIMVR